MKKTVNVNLNGRVFTIDEDACQLLENYLHNLRIHFRKEESSDEIIADFEGRIEELFSEKIRKGYDIIDISYVEEVIARVGKPADFSENESESENEGENKTDDFGKQSFNQEYKKAEKKLYRDSNNKILGGVCSGISAYFGWDALPLRIVFFVLIFFTTLWIIPIYLLVWLILPEARTAEEKLRMQGKPVTVENIGKTVASDAEKSGEKQSGFAQFLGVFLKICLFTLFCVFVAPLLFVIIIVIIVLFALLFGAGDSLINHFPGIGSDVGPMFSFISTSTAAVFSAILLAIVIFIAIVFCIAVCFSKSKPVNKGVKWTVIITLILAFILFLGSIFKIKSMDRLGNNNNTIQFMNWKWINQIDREVVEGNGILSEKEVYLPAVESILLEEGLYAHFQIEQSEEDSISLLLNGDENLIDEVKYEIKGHKLYISAKELVKKKNTVYIRYPQNSNLVIRLKIPTLKDIDIKSVAQVSIKNPFVTEELKINMDGTGRFTADSLTVRTLNVNMDGAANVELKGFANTANFQLGGAGKIEAYELLSNEVYAHSGGVGSIHCNPVEYLDGKIDGIGTILYKNEPTRKSTRVNGVGKIAQE
jgi:phage shock protein PspC (stress-responsive transcriptional regulator)